MMINYIIQVVLFQVLFLAIYDFFLSKETFFTKNRWYLLSTPILSFLLPFFKIPTFQKVASQEVIVYLPEIFLSPEKILQETFWYQNINYLDVVFGIGIIVFAILFILKLTKIIKLITSHQLIKNDGFTLVIIPKQTKAFSFFNYIFLGEEIPESQKKQIIKHELVHSKQKHSLDLLFFEFLKIVMWFNPMIFMYQKRITLIHEYISDEVAAKLESKEKYINNLLSNYFQVENIAFVNQFYKQTFIKKRIIMITKNKSKKMNQLKYLLLIPLLASMLFYTSCTNSGKEKQSKIADLKLENGQLKDSLKDIKKKLEITSSLTKYVASKSLKAKSSDGSVSFMAIDKAPTFPSCESGDKDCFSKSVQKHFVLNFDSKMVTTLGLDAGKKRVFITFKIDKQGKVVEIKARAPHKKIEEEVIKVMSTLPKMIPGKQDGKKVAVKYSIPFTLIVE